MSSDVCPYCARHPGNGGGPTRDHVFVAALGGRAKVDACRHCNSTIGHAIEGPLLKPGSFLNLLAQARGGGRPLPGTLAGEGVTYDLATREIRSGKPVTVTTAGDERHYELRGSPAQVRALLAKQGIRGADAEVLLKTAVPADTADAQVNTTVTVDLPLSDRLAAKTALGCGAIAFGDAFTNTPLGALLRDVLWGQTSCVEHLDHRATAAYDGVLAASGLQVELPSLAPDPDSQVPVEGRPGVLVHLAGTGLGAGGLVVDAPLPPGHELPLLVRDQPGGALVADTTAAVLRAVATDND
jgi:hypothetical protein